MKNLSDSFCFLIFFVSIFVTFSTISAVPVRLIYGDSQRGTVQVYYGTWFTVCDDSWDINDARVVCKTLGFYDAVSAYCCARFGRGGGYIVANLGCSGSESDLSQCSPSGFYTGGCGHHEDAGVVCRPHIVRARLVGGKTSTEGRVELYYNNLWGTVCDDSWDINDAKVVCRMLGYVAVRAVGNAYFGKGSGTIWMDGVRCSGSETNIEQCHFNGWGSHDCQHLEDAGVICRPYAAPQVPPLNVRASSTNSTTIVVKWDAILSNGTDTPIQSYRIYCRKVNTSVTVTSTTSASFRQAMFSSLDIYTNYEIQVAGINQNGEGARSIALIVRTDEEIPKAAPNVTSIINDNSTSLYVAWDPLSSGQILGKLLGYYIWYSPAPGSCSFLNNCSSANYTSCANATAAPNSNCSLSTNSTASANTTAAPDSKCSLSSEATGNSCSYAFNASAPHMNVTVEPDASQFVLRGLTKFTAYWVQIAVFNSKGVGPRSPAVRRCTDQDVPSAPPSNLRVLNQTSTSIEIAWDGIPVERMHGVLLGYRVAYGLLGIPGSNASLVQIDVAEPDTYQQTLTGLRKYSSYWITVTGFTSIGDGPVSEPVNATTDQHVPSVPPANVRAYSNSSNSLQVDWDQVPSALAHGVLLGYLVTYRKSGAGAVLRRQTALDRTGILLTGLQPYSVYDIHVCAFTVKGYGPQSGVVSVRTEQDVPSTYPSNVSVIMETSSSISIQWDPVSTPQIHGVLLGYHVTYGALKNSSVNVTCQTGPSSHQLVLSGLDAYTTYWVEVAAFTVKGPGPFSPPIMATTDQDVPSAAPSSMRTTNVTSTSLEVHWAPVPPQQARGVLLGYTVSFSSLNKTSHTKNVSPNSTQLVLRGLQAYTDYNITLSAFTNKGSGPQARLPVRTAEDVPDTSPNNLRVLNQTSSSIEIAWDGIPVDRVHGVLLGYRVAYGLLGIPGSNVSIVGPDTFQTTLTGLRKYSSYWITVTGFTSIGDGLASEAVNATTDQHVPSVPPSNVRTHVNGSTSIQVDWNPVPIVFIHGVLVGYLVSYRKRGTGAFVTNQSAPGTTSILLTGLQPYSVYDIHVSAFTIKGYGPRSGIVSVRTDQDVPSAWPPNARTTITTPSIIFLQWDPVPTPQIHGVLLGYHVTYGALKNSSVNVTRQTGPSSHQLVLSGLDAYTTYWMEVAAFTVKGSGPFSPPIMATTDQDVPSTAPGNMRTTNVTSTSVTLHWDPVPSRQTRGLLLGYAVSFASLNGSRSVIHAPPSSTELALRGLKAFTVYDITLVAFTTKGTGPVARIMIRTEEDVPSVAPTIIKAANQSSTSLTVQWSRIPPGLTRGVLLGYRVTYTQYDSGATYTRDTAAGVTRMTLTSLTPYMVYTVSVAGFTSKGTGPESYNVTLSTDEDVPSVAPFINHATNLSSTSILVQWTAIPTGHVRGVLLGYRVYFKSVHSTAYLSNQTGPSEVRVLLRGLDVYTGYTIQVAAFTAKGEGPRSTDVDVSTEEDVPIASPINVQAANQSSTSLRVRWGPVPEGRVHGVLLGYHVTYRQVNGSWFRSDVTKERELVLSGLQVYTVYSVRVAAYTRMGDGPASPEVIAHTDEGVPAVSPDVTRADNRSSTSILVQWRPVPPGLTQGVLLGYHVIYSESMNTTTVVSKRTKETSIVLSGLRKYTRYRVTVAAYTSRGDGVRSNATFVTTDQDVPSVAPSRLRTANITSSAISVTWDPIPAQRANGKLLGYRVTCNASSYHVTRNEASGSLRYTLSGLLSYTWYRIYVTGFTVKGDGPISEDLHVRTAENAPDLAPQNVRAVNQSSTSLLVTWDPLPAGHTRGELAGYRVWYRAVDDSDDERVVLVSSDRSDVIIRDLRLFTVYAVQVEAFTGKGTGPRSEPYRVSTDEGVPTAAPYNITTEPVNSTAVIIQWHGVSKEHLFGYFGGYHVTYRRLTYASCDVSVRTFGTQVVLGSLEPNVEYKVKVSASTSLGDGPWSEAVMFSIHGAIEYNTAAMVSNGSAAWQFVAPPVGVVLALIILVLVGGAVYWKRRNREPKEDRVKVSPRDDIELKEKDDKDPIAFKNPTYDDI